MTVGSDPLLELLMVLGIYLLKKKASNSGGGSQSEEWVEKIKNMKGRRSSVVKLILPYLETIMFYIEFIRTKLNIFPSRNQNDSYVNFTLKFSFNSSNSW